MTAFILGAELIQLAIIVWGLLYLPENFSREAEDFDPVNGVHTLDKEMGQRSSADQQVEAERVVPEVDVQHQM